ncbi:histidine-containing phosphotransfer protein 2 isoform X1 [Triticum aestivum]|uniref:histidine-containing phosphotransfer protein 2 isoform X1 n=1 Tax=Triticum aestivum TaxID=4565 RepID=UPI00084233EC|nr:histidine-containing phosphotransfer protein 2-like isoform X1 [Triticum aestivum]
MAAAALRAQLNAHITGMYTDGVMDEDTFEELRDEGTAVEVSRLFIYDASKIIDDIDILMEEPKVDFDEVEALTQHLMRCTSSLSTALMLFFIWMCRHGVRTSRHGRTIECWCTASKPRLHALRQFLCHTIQTWVSHVIGSC